MQIYFGKSSLQMNTDVNNYLSNPQELEQWCRTFSQAVDIMNAFKNKLIYADLTIVLGGNYYLVKGYCDNHFGNDGRDNPMNGRHFVAATYVNTNIVNFRVCAPPLYRGIIENTLTWPYVDLFQYKPETQTFTINDKYVAGHIYVGDPLNMPNNEDSVI